MVAQLLGLAFLFLACSPVPSKTVEVQVNPNWEVVYRDTNVYGVLGKAVILECGTTLPDMYIWSFTKPGTDAIKAVVYNLGKGQRLQQQAQALGQLSVISNSAAVSIEQLPLAAQGLFTCQAFYDIEQEPKVFFYYVYLTVRVPVSKPYLLMSDVSPVEGSSVWMRCNLENGTGPIQYAWQHETSGGNVSAFAQGNTSVVNVTNISRNHTGWYRCVATNAVNSESSDGLWMNTFFGPDVPRIDVTPYSITERGYSALERETVSLLCQAPSNPTSQYVWFYNNSQIYTGPQLTITKILRMHTGDYACMAQNTYLNTHSKKTISLTVYFGPDVPQIDVSPYSLTERGYSAVERENVSLLCQAPSNPASQYVWFYNNSQIYTGPQLTITKILRMHTGDYACMAQNTYLNTRSKTTINLTVYFGPDVPRIDVTPYSITERGYSALEGETVSLLCQAPSNPTSQYVWFYNNSQIYTGPQLTITKILRVHTGDYACLAQNTNLNTRSKKTISLTVYYPPDGTPSCSVEPALNHTALRLLCSWPGGLPSPSLHWTGPSPSVVGQAGPDTQLQTNLLTNTAILLSSEDLTSNSSSYTCRGSHLALKQAIECNVRTYIPPTELVCFAYVTNNKEYLMLSCTWDGGAPKALVWWEGPGVQGKGGEENSNILILRYGTASDGKPYTCHAKHPLLIQTKTCRLTLEAPVLLTQRRVVSVYEGSDVQLNCNLRANYLPVSEITWYNNQGMGVRDTSKYALMQTSAWANLTVRDTDETQDSGDYRCSSSNAVGGTEINVTLVVKRHPVPPNATLLNVMYNSRMRNEVELEWRVENEEGGGWTGFVLQHIWVSEKPGRRGSNNDSKEGAEERIGAPDWYSNIIQDPGVRVHTVGQLTPTVTYQFRITPVNHRTLGHPSAAKTPAEPSYNMYPAVIGAAIGGMLIAAFLTALLLVFIVRNRNNSPRLHDMLFGLQHSQSRENINFPEDEVVGRLEGGIEEIMGSSSPAPAMALPRAASPLTTSPRSAPLNASQAPPPGDDNEPVSVTITVNATGS